jgi:putative acetyltransferase
MIELRDARDADAAGVIRLVADCFAEYPGCVLDVEREEPELLAPASSFERFWVLEADGEVVGCCGLATHAGEAGPVVELKKMYLRRDHRGAGLAERLAAKVEERAREARATGLVLWSDTRFTRAHRFYERIGYRRTGRTRDLGDLSNTTEYEFRKAEIGKGV